MAQHKFQKGYEQGVVAGVRYAQASWRRAALFVMAFVFTAGLGVGFALGRML